MKSGSKGTVKVSAGSFKYVDSDSSKKERAGRPNSLSEEKLQQLLKLYYTQPYSYRELADMFGVSRMTVWRAVQTAATLQL